MSILHIKKINIKIYAVPNGTDFGINAILIVTLISLWKTTKSVSDNNYDVQN